MSKVISQWIPIIDWLPRYQYRKFLKDDLIAGLTLSTIIIPQSLAYSSLASLPAVYGLYVAFIPPLIYTFLGLSPYNSIGVFAIVSIAMYDGLEAARQAVDISVDLENLSIGLATFMAFSVSILLLMLSILGAGSFFTKYLLRDSFISAFSSAAAVTICSTQLSAFFGLSLPRFVGPLSLIYTWISFFKMIPKINLITFSIGISSMFMMIYIKKLEVWIRTMWRKKYRPNLHARISPLFPDVLATVFFMAAISYFLSLSSKHSVKIIGNIPDGLPTPSVPWGIFSELSTTDSLDALRAIAPYLLSLSFISIVISASIIKTFPSPVIVEDNTSILLENTKNTELPLNQEMFAISMAGFIGSFFSCYLPTVFFLFLVYETVLTFKKCHHV
jgi:MFS superfamily sulfate permease-like transporter